MTTIADIVSRKASWRTAQARLPFTDKALVLAKLRDTPAMMQDTFCVFDELKAAGVIDRYAVAGAVGAMFYTEAFRTRTIDFLVSLATAEGATRTSFAPIFAWLALRGYTQFDNGGHILIEGWPVKFLPVSDLLSKEALETAHILPFEELLVPVVQAEYLAAEALKLSRPEDVGRVDSLRRSDGFDTMLFEQLIERFGLHEQWRKFESFLKP